MPWGPTREFQGKNRVVRGKSRKNHKNSIASGGCAPEPPGLREFSIALIVFSKSASKNSWKFSKLIKFSNFTLLISTNFWKKLLPSGGSAPRTPYYSVSILYCLFFPYWKILVWPKIKNSENFHFSRIFLIIFQIFIDFNAYF